jgi:hypothetical protein
MLNEFRLWGEQVRKTLKFVEESGKARSARGAGGGRLRAAQVLLNASGSPCAIRRGWIRTLATFGFWGPILDWGGRSATREKDTDTETYLHATQCRTTDSYNLNSGCAKLENQTKFAKKLLAWTDRA